MGGSMATLVIYNFNITRKELLTYHDTIDLIKSKYFDRAVEISSPMELFNTAPEWTINDQIVTVISVPTIVSPTAYLLKYDNVHTIEHDPTHVAHVTIMENEQRYMEDETYDELIEPYITEIGIDFEVYKTSEFKLLLVDQLMISVFNIATRELFVKKIKIKNLNNPYLNDDNMDFLNPSKLYQKFPKWNSNHTIIVIVGVSIGSKPKGYVIDAKNEKLTKNNNYSVIVNKYSHYANKFNDDYDPTNDPYILEFDVCFLQSNIVLTFESNHVIAPFKLIKYEIEEC